MGNLILSVIFIFLLIFGVGMAGKIWKNGSSGFRSSIWLIITVLVGGAILVTHLSAFDGLINSIQTSFGNIPYMKEIDQYGSINAFFVADKMNWINSFIELFTILIFSSLAVRLAGLNSGPITGLRITFNIVAILFALYLYNFFVKTIPSFPILFNVIGYFALVLAIMNLSAYLPFLATLKEGVQDSKEMNLAQKVIGTQFGTVLKSAFFQAIAIVVVLFCLTEYFPSLTIGMADIGSIINMCLPIVLSLMGLGLLLSSSRK